ncbi:MAG TPA: hypothetical protein VKV40_18535 [Ktedonobacteraceae bacterium]|nr:hypothetical protein [Ktedonobacteraceae bacterium]
MAGNEDEQTRERGASGKRWRHSGGYPLWAQVGLRLEPLEEWETTGMERCVVVSYRSAVVGTSALLLFHCPGCGRPLRLWWSLPPEGRG